jgi:hypothetical protein
MGGIGGRCPPPWPLKLRSLQLPGPVESAPCKLSARRIYSREANVIGQRKNSSVPTFLLLAQTNSLCGKWVLGSTISIYLSSQMSTRECFFYVRLLAPPILIASYKTSYLKRCGFILHTFKPHIKPRLLT